MTQKTMTDKEVKQHVRKCMNHLKLKRYELGITKADVDRAVAVTKVKNISGSWASKDEITIGLKPWNFFNPEKNHKGHLKDSSVFNEYRAFNDDPLIGCIQTHTLRNMLKVIIAHEVAHHVQRAIAPRVKRYDKRDKKPHGFVFRDIYRMLRRDLINPYITAKNLLNSASAGRGELRGADPWDEIHPRTVN